MMTPAPVRELVRRPGSQYKCHWVVESLLRIGRFVGRAATLHVDSILIAGDNVFLFMKPKRPTHPPPSKASRASGRIVLVAVAMMLGLGPDLSASGAQPGSDLVFLVDDNPADFPGCDTATLYDFATNRIVHQGPTGPRTPKAISPGRAAFSPDGTVVLSNHLHFTESVELAPYNIPSLYMSRLDGMGEWSSSYVGGQPLARLGGVMVFEDNDRFLVPLARGDPKAHPSYTGEPYSLAVFRLSEMTLAVPSDDVRMSLYMLGDPVSEMEVSGIPIAAWRSSRGNEATVVTHDGLVLRLGLDPLEVRSSLPIPPFRDGVSFIAEIISKGSATISRDGRWLVSTRWDAGEIVLTDLDSGAHSSYEVPFGPGQVGGVAFSHSGGSADMLAVHARISVELYRLQDTELVHLGGQRISPPSYPRTDDCLGGWSTSRCGLLAQPLIWSNSGQYIIAGASFGNAEYAILEINPTDGSSSSPRYLEVCPMGPPRGRNMAAVAVSSNGAQYSPPESPPTMTTEPAASATFLPTHTSTTTPSHTPTPSSTPPLLPATVTPSATATQAASPTQVQTATTGYVTPTPSMVYLPLTLVEACPPRDLFTDVVLVIDASTSMRDLTADGRRKIDVAIAAAEVFIEGLRLDSGRDRIAIVIFNETAETLQRLTDSRREAVAALSRIRTAVQSRVDLGIDRASVELLTRGRPGHVHAMVVLSDGKANSTGRNQPGIAARVAHRARITVYAVGMGPSMDELVLREIAGQAERFYPAPDPRMLHAIYSDLSKRVPCPPIAYWGRR